jgi:hypothetical protein
MFDRLAEIEIPQLAVLCRRISEICASIHPAFSGAHLLYCVIVGLFPAYRMD